MEIDPPLAREARVSPVNDVVLIPPREIIPPTTLGDLPFGFVPLIDIPCVMAREKELGAGDMFTTDPEGSMVLCDYSPVTILAPDSGSIPQDISALEPKAEAPYKLLNFPLVAFSIALIIFSQIESISLSFRVSFFG